MSRSKIEEAARLVGIDALMEQLSPAEQVELLYQWDLWARPEQLEPMGDWRQWALVTGRGFGKSRAGAEWIRKQLVEMPGCRAAIVARTIGDARSTCVEGESGLLSCFPPDSGVTWNRSLGEGRLPNGSSWQCFTSEKPDQLRGPQFHVMWADELAAWLKGLAAWEQASFVVRLPWAADPRRAGRIVVTTTPRPLRQIRELLADPLTVVTRGRTSDNWANLNELTRAKLEKLRGTRLGRQELDGEVLDDTPGALWTRALIESCRKATPPMVSLVRIVVGVDPAVTSTEDSDETGIVVCGKTESGRRFVLEDRSMRGKPHEWAREVVNACNDWQTDEVVVEVNQGGDMVRAVLEEAPGGEGLAIHEVRASRGKYTRAQPVATAYEAGEVHHCGRLETLEDQLCTWTPDSGESPDRLDATVWALTALAGKGSARIPTKVPKGTAYARLQAERM